MIIADLVTRNLKDEAEAINGYLPLLEELEQAGDMQGAELVREIISDEKNHLNTLQVILMHHDTGIKISPDNMNSTFDYLKENIK